MRALKQRISKQNTNDLRPPAKRVQYVGAKALLLEISKGVPSIPSFRRPLR
jgi:hypothetical protein